MKKKRFEKEKKRNRFGAPWVPHIWGVWGAPLGAAASAAFSGDKKNWATSGAPNGFKDWTRAMMIPNMCLVLKLDNGKVVSIVSNYRNHLLYSKLLL